MMKPEPSEVTWRGALGLGPRKFLNRSSRGEPGGSCGMAPCGGALRGWLVEILTTEGSSLAARSAKESGAGRASAGAMPPRRVSAKMAQRVGMARICSFLGTWRGGIGGQFRQQKAEQTGKTRIRRGFYDGRTGAGAQGSKARSLKGTA